MDLLNDMGATFHETKVSNKQLSIPSSQWLTKVTISHAECQDLLEHVDLESLRRHGDVVLRMPRDMNKFDMSSEGERHPVRRGDMVYIGFFDIGIRTDLTTRRMHLRAPQKVMSRMSSCAANGRMMRLPQEC